MTASKCYAAKSKSSPTRDEMWMPSFCHAKLIVSVHLARIRKSFGGIALQGIKALFTVKVKTDMSMMC